MTGSESLTRLQAFNPVLAILLAGVFPATGWTTTATDLVTGVITWKHHHANVEISLTQILSDQLRAFYDGRGFKPRDIEIYARSCVYMTVIRNEWPRDTVSFATQNWRGINQQGESELRSTDDWLESWKQTGLGNAELIAFEWAQFPTTQNYLPGDWNQGMLSIGLKAGDQFDLAITWSHGGKEYRYVVKHVTCSD